MSADLQEHGLVFSPISGLPAASVAYAALSGVAAAGSLIRHAPGAPSLEPLVALIEPSEFNQWFQVINAAISTLVSTLIVLSVKWKKRDGDGRKGRGAPASARDLEHRVDRHSEELARIRSEIRRDRAASRRRQRRLERAMRARPCNAAEDGSGDCLRETDAQAGPGVSHGDGPDCDKS